MTIHSSCKQPVLVADDYKIQQEGQEVCPFIYMEELQISEVLCVGLSKCYIQTVKQCWNVIALFHREPSTLAQVHFKSHAARAKPKLGKEDLA